MFTTFLSPPRTLMGPGSIEQAGVECARLGKHAFIVTGKGSSLASGALERLENSLRQAGIKSTRFAEIESDPTAQTVLKGAAIARKVRADVVIGLGGGSPLDAAKAIAGAALAGAKCKLESLSGCPKEDVLPIIAIPTTAGTGSEVTRVSVITFPEKLMKAAIASDAFIPQVAILDPELTLSMPPHVTAATGMDALTHAMEAYLSILATPQTDTLALSAIKRIGGNLLSASLNGRDMDARSAMLLGQMEAGLAFSNASVGLVHAMSRPLGARHGIPHGLANAILLPRVMDFNRPACIDRMADMGLALGLYPQAKSRHDLALACVSILHELLADTGLPSTLTACRVKASALPAMAKEAATNQSALYNVRTATSDQVLDLYRASL